MNNTLGTPEHAAEVTEGRHQGTKVALQWLAFSHLPEALRDFSRPFYQTAVELITRVKTDSPELTTALNTLISAKDHAMRAGIKHQTGRAGSVPRPQEVVDPPQFETQAWGQSEPVRKMTEGLKKAAAGLDQLKGPQA